MSTPKDKAIPILSEQDFSKLLFLIVKISEHEFTEKEPQANEIKSAANAFHTHSYNRNDKGSLSKIISTFEILKQQKPFKLEELEQQQQKLDRIKSVILGAPTSQLEESISLLTLTKKYHKDLDAGINIIKEAIKAYNAKATVQTTASQHTDKTIQFQFEKIQNDHRKVTEPHPATPSAAPKADKKIGGPG